MTWIVLSITIDFIVLVWHMLVKRGWIFRGGPLPLRICICASVMTVSAIACTEFLSHFPPTMLTTTKPTWMNLELLRIVGVLWLQICSALIASFMLLANGREVSVVVHNN